MVSGGRGVDLHHSSAEWRVVRGMHIVLLLECLLFSIGTATPSSKDYGDPLVTVDDTIQSPANKFRLNSYPPALQEFQVHSTQKDSIGPKIVWSSRSGRTGLLSVLRRFVAQFSSAATLRDLCIEVSRHDQHDIQQKFTFGSERADFDVSSSSRSRKLLLRDAGNAKHRSPSPALVWAPSKHQQELRNGGRRVLVETVSSPALPETQEVSLGPPAPPDLVHNEKQDWNQDYAEPDVHPPSSN